MKWTKRDALAACRRLRLRLWFLEKSAKNDVDIVEQFIEQEPNSESNASSNRSTASLTSTLMLDDNPTKREGVK